MGNMWGPSHFHRMISDMLLINICYSLKCIETTEGVYITKEFSSHRVCLEHQHGRRLLVAVLENQYGGHDVMTKRSIVAPFFISSAKSKLPNKTICVSCDTYFLSLGSISVKDRMVKECPAWAEKGYCETYEKFMIRNCRTSCMAGGYIKGKRQLSLRK